MPGDDTGTTNGSSALDVGFTSIAGRHAESSLQAESRSSGRWSSRSSKHSTKEERQLDAQPVTPENARTDRRYADERDGSAASSGHRTRKSGGFLLESVFANASPRSADSSFNREGKRNAQDGQLRVDKKRSAVASRLSGELSQRHSPLSRELALDGEADEKVHGHRRVSRPQTMDPAQLVQMALSLSESRKRNVSGTLQVPLPPSKRVTSMPMSNYGTVRSTSAARKRSSQFSDASSRDSPHSNTSGMDELPNPVVDNVVYTFTPATLSRAEKARRYFELASEYRRLMQHLPPLKSDASAPDNYTFETRNTPGSHMPDIQRVTSYSDAKHVLGRQYNPIQALRNRRVRIREKRPFPAPPDSWVHTVGVSTWIDDVEAATESADYRADMDRIQLPRYVGEDDPSATSAQQAKIGHRKTDTVGSVITRPENSWTIEPTELLADAYWTEQRDNKAYIENRHGNLVFPKAVRQSIDTPRISVEVHRSKDDLGNHGVATEDLEPSGRPSRRRRLMMPLAAQSESHRRKHRRILARSPSETSESDSEVHIAHGAAGGDNIGPLERHMQELIAKDESGELSSPEVDHWDAKPRPQQRGSLDQSRRESSNAGVGSRASLEVPRESHQRSRSAEGRMISLDSTAEAPTVHAGSEPTSPSPQKANTRGLLDDAHAGARRSLEVPRPQGPPQAPTLPSFHSRSKDRVRVEPDPVEVTAATATTLSPIFSGDAWQARSSMDTERRMDIRRHKTNDSMASSLNRMETASTSGTFASMREPGNAVGRLFKGGRDRIGTLVRGERHRNRNKLETSIAGGHYRGASDVSDYDEADSSNGYLRKWKGTDSPADESDVSPRASLDQARTKKDYQLPAFTSSTRGRNVIPGTPITADTNPFERVKGGQGDVNKGQKLMPPRLNIPQDDATKAPMATAIRFDTSRKSYGDLGLEAPLPSATTAMSRSPRQRQWSIYDQAQPMPQSGRITTKDIAGVRALLLCSGIKAREIQRRANNPREPLGQEVVKAAETAGKHVSNVPLKDEHTVAARLLSNHLEASLSSLESALTKFQSETARQLASSMDDLQDRASGQLAKHVHEASDDADAFIVELTTKQPQQTKRVDEAIDMMLRRRRRQFWLLRQVGFKLLEWLVLGLLWWIWFLVVVFNTARKVVVVLARFVRWLFVF